MPPLTTVRQDVTEMGREMARQVLRLMGGEEPGPPLVLATSLVRRASA